jgi:hypothetical protein
MANASNEWLQNVKVGDVVTRNLAGVPMKLKVTEVTHDRILCSPWEFSRRNGAEIDGDMGWNESVTGSFLEAEDDNA